MADIKDQQKYERVLQVLTTGRKHDGSPADIEKVGDLTVAMYDPKNPNFPRDIQMRHAQDQIIRKGYKVGVPQVKPAKKKQSRKEIEAEKAILEKEAGGKATGALAKPKE